MLLAFVAQRRTLLDPEAVLFVDDDRPERLETYVIVSSACVPTTMSTLASAKPSRITWRSRALHAPAQQLDRKRPLAAEHALVVDTETLEVLAQRRQMLFGEYSVGAMSAPCRPPSIAARSVVSATTVLPEPTSPCKSRCMGSGDAMSAAMSASTRRCALVSAKW